MAVMTISAKIENETREKLRVITSQQDLTASQVLRRLLENYIEDHQCLLEKSA
jgi:predicted DNA-binding protein